MTEQYAIIRQAGNDLNLESLATAASPVLRRARADLLAEMALRPGVLFTDLSAQVAPQLAKALEEAQTQIWLIPQSELVTPPPRIRVQKSTVLPEGFQIKVRQETTLLPWQEITYFDAIQIPTTSKEVVRDRTVGSSFVDLANDPEEDGAGWSDIVVVDKIQTAGPELLEFVCREPWLHVQIDKETFQYRNSGLAQHPTAAKNFLALAIMFKTRCDPAGEGPGIGFLFDGKPNTRQRVLSLRAYENLLQWRLTLRAHGLPIVPPEGSSG